LNTILYLVAQATQVAADATQPAPGSQEPPWWANPSVMLYAVLGLGLLFVLTSSGRANRQEEKRHKEMLANLKRGDRVQTIGGILGSVVETRDSDVVIKVDEGNNTKIRVVREAIKRVTSEEGETK
jgi:preprotein translocase subunit YajC